MKEREKGDIDGKWGLVSVVWSPQIFQEMLNVSFFSPEWSSCSVYDSVRNVHTWSKFKA